MYFDVSEPVENERYLFKYISSREKKNVYKINGTKETILDLRIVFTCFERQNSFRPRVKRIN